MAARSGSPAARLAELGLEVVHLSAPNGSAAFARNANVLQTFGHWPQNGARPVTGKLGLDRNVSQGHDAARLAIQAVLGTLDTALGSLDAAGQFVSLDVVLNTTPEFTQHAEVADGASDLLLDVFGDDGRAVRTVVGVASLPANHLLEIAAVVEV
ncbi:MAG: RidA family protein [Acidimicrobiales bacterium]|nr:RidA family protein [Acidimicrobiales bacterium]